MDKPTVVTPTFAEVEVLQGLWSLTAEGREAAYLSEVRDKVAARRRELGLPEPALTTVATTLRNGVAKGVFREMQFDGGKPTPLVRAGVRSSLGSSRAAQKVAYKATLSPDKVLPQMLRELASLFPADARERAVVEFVKALGYSAEMASKVGARPQERVRPHGQEAEEAVGP